MFLCGSHRFPSPVLSRPGFPLEKSFSSCVTTPETKCDVPPSPFPNLQDRIPVLFFLLSPLDLFKANTMDM
ncbi:hypothetical protein STEG23_024196 [Scotinomys teguina]